MKGKWQVTSELVNHNEIIVYLVRRKLDVNDKFSGWEYIGPLFDTKAAAQKAADGLNHIEEYGLSGRGEQHGS